MSLELKTFKSDYLSRTSKRTVKSVETITARHEAAIEKFVALTPAKIEPRLIAGLACVRTPANP